MLAIPFFVAAAIVLTGSALGEGKGGCERKTISMLVSPDDAWVALVQENICSDGAFVTTITDAVQLVRRDGINEVQLAWRAEEPKHEDDILVVDEGGHTEYRPLTRWLSPHKLQITIPNKSLIGLQKRSYEGIDITIKFEPDDPVERERFLKGLGIIPK